MYIIRTAPNPTGDKIVAKCNGKQRTTPVDPSKGRDWNHGNAAGTLALALDLPWHDGIEHDHDGIVHRFAWTPPVLIDLARASIK